MKFGRMSLALVTMLALGIGSVGIATASTTMFHQASTTPVHMQYQASSTMPGKAGSVKTVSATKSTVINSADNVTITPTVDPQVIKDQSAVNTQTKDNYGMHQLMVNNISNNISTNHYVYMNEHMTNTKQHMNQPSTSSMGQHMNSGVGQHMSSGMM